MEQSLYRKADSRSASQEICGFFKPKSSLLCSQELATSIYPEPDESSLHIVMPNFKSEYGVVINKPENKMGAFCVLSLFLRSSLLSKKRFIVYSVILCQMLM
jgi:hypothetical protein